MGRIRKIPYRGWSARSRLFQGLSVLAATFVIAFRFWTIGFTPWYVIGLLLSFFVFALAVIFDQQLSLGLELHHFPEFALLFFVGCFMGEIDALHLSLLITALWPAFFLVMLGANRIRKTTEPKMRTARDVSIFWVFALAGFIAGVLVR